MQPITLTIEGKWFDSFLYRERLYLFGLDGTVTQYNWKQMLSLLPLSSNERVVVSCTFFDHSYLYDEKLRLLLSDPDIHKTLTSKMERAAGGSLEIPFELLQRTFVRRDDAPFPFPHTAFEMYKRTAYVSSSEGVYEIDAREHLKRPWSSKSRRIWDCPVVFLSASWNALACSCASEGLWQIDVRGGDAVQLSTSPANVHEWAYQSIYATSYERGGFLADFDVEKDQRGFNKVIDVESIFGARYLSWGARDKLCAYTDRTLHFVEYAPFRNRARFTDLGILRIDDWKGNLVMGATALFGTVLEFSNALVVVQSDGDVLTLPFEPVNWRVYPRSKHYSNHLHVTADNALHIVAFNHDVLRRQVGLSPGLGVKPSAVAA